MSNIGYLNQSSTLIQLITTSLLVLKLFGDFYMSATIKKYLKGHFNFCYQLPNSSHPIKIYKTKLKNTIFRKFLQV